MKKLMILAAVAAMTVAAEAKFGTIGLPVDQDYFVGRDTTPVLIKGVDVWSTKADAQVKVSRVRSVDAYTNAYDITTTVTTNIVNNPTDEIKYVQNGEYDYIYNHNITSEDRYSTKITNVSHSVIWTGNMWYYYVQGKGNKIISGTRKQEVLDFSSVSGFPNVFVRTPYKQDHWTTNVVTTVTTNRAWRVKSGSNYSTNLIVSASCQNGFISHVMTNDMYLVYGDLVHTEGLTDTAGTATAATIIYQE